MESTRQLIAYTLALAATAYSARASLAADDATVTATYGAVYQDKEGDIGSANYSISADGSDYITGSDVVMVVKFCPRESPFFCVYGDFYEFAVPRHDLAAGEKWQFAGRTYEVVPGYRPHAMFQQPVRSNEIDRTYRILNEEITFNVIRTTVTQKNKTCTKTFLYSRAHGILGEFGRCDDSEKHDSWNYWLVGSEGIGSPGFERAISPKATMTQAEAVTLYRQ